MKLLLVEDDQVLRDSIVELIGNGDVVLFDATGHPDLLVALQERLVELAVGVGVPLINRILDAAPPEVGQLALQPIDPSRQGTFTDNGRRIGLLQRRANTAFLLTNRLVERLRAEPGFVEVRFILLER